MSKHISIGGEWFEVIKPRNRVVTPVYPTKWDYTDIMEAYDNPSEYKIDVWNYWRDFMGGDGYYFGRPFISSRNCFAFTVMFNVYHENTGKFVGVARITKDHNRLYLC